MSRHMGLEFWCASAVATLSLASNSGHSQTVIGSTGADQVVFSTAQFSVAQGSPVVRAVVMHAGSAATAVTMNYQTSDGSAASGRDYVGESGTLFWSAGDTTSRIIEIPIIGTAVYSGSKNFYVSLSTADAGAGLGAQATASISIVGSRVLQTPAGGVIVDAASPGAHIGGNQIGTNLASFHDVTEAGIPQALSAIGAHLVRWPGGSSSDLTHWQDNSGCDGSYAWPESTFDNFMQQIVIPAGLQAAVTVNYGTNIACDAGGDPSEAAAWVSYALAQGYESNIHHWTVGNEVYGFWEYDLHPIKNDPATYAAAVSGPQGYYQLMKAADPTAKIGVVVEGIPGAWDDTVLTSAPYDFVELHWYPEQPGQESDAYLLLNAPRDLRHTLAALRNELAAAGNSNTPIMLGEFNSVSYNPGKQTSSVVNALFIGMTYGEIFNNGVALGSTWFGYGPTCATPTANNSASLYGWQDFGEYNLVGGAETGCADAPALPPGVVFPAGNAQHLVSQFAAVGGNMLQVAVDPGLPLVRAYAAGNGAQYAVMLFNLSAGDTSTITLNVINAPGGPHEATLQTYGKAQYDNSQQGIWTGPVTHSLGATSGSTVKVTLPPYSINVLTLD